MTSSFRRTTYAAAARKPRVSLPASPVTTVRVVPIVWAKAMELAGGDTRRLQIIDGETVLVHNNENRR